MAFMGIALIILIVLACILIGAVLLMLTLFIVGLILRKKHKKVSRACLTASGVILAIFAALALYIFFPRPIEVNTPNGTEIVYSNTESSYAKAVREGDIDKVSKMLDRRPFLIYDYHSVYYSGYYIDGLMYAVVDGNRELAECIVSHGLTFDNGVTLEGTEYYDYALDFFFDRIPFLEKEIDVSDWLEFMIDNGAAVEYSDGSNALFEAVDYICYDGVITDEDVEIVSLLIEKGADISDSPEYYDQPLFGRYDENVKNHQVDVDAENTIKVAQLLSGGEYLKDYSK